MRQGEPDKGAKHFEKCRKPIENEMRREADPRAKRAEISTLNMKLRRCKPKKLSMLDGQLKQHVEGEEKTTIPLQNLQHPAHQVLSGTLAMKDEERIIGPLRRPQVGPK